MSRKHRTAISPDEVWSPQSLSARAVRINKPRRELNLTENSPFWIHQLKNQGYAVVPNVLTPSECDDIIDQTWEWLARTGIQRNDPSSWMKDRWPINYRGTIQRYRIGHERFMWQARMNSNVIGVFEEIWGTRELLTSFDGMCIIPPTEMVTNFNCTPDFHTDQSPRRQGFHCVQGKLNLEEAVTKDAVLACYPGSHKLHAEFFRRFKGYNTSSDFIVISKEDLQWMNSVKGLVQKRIPAPRGSFIIFDSRLIHSIVPAKALRKIPRWSYTLHICMTPRAWADETTLQARVSAFKSQRMTTHWPHRVHLFPEDPEFPMLPEFELGDVGEKLVGIKDYNGYENCESCKWEEKSIIHREKLAKLQEHIINHPKEVREVNGVRVCCSIDFLIGMGSEGTRVYVGLGKDGVERAVKRLPRDACSHVAQQEKKVLIEHNTTKSNNVVRYWFLDDTSDREYIFLILDLCEETLDNFVKNSSIDHLVEIAPQIIQQILKGLADLHRDPMPILHRDVKPSNILRDVHNNWLLADFGISRILTGGASTHPSVQRGTEYWRAVESYPSDGMTDDDKVRYKKESDIQVAGMVAFYVVTKSKHPFGEWPDLHRNLLDGNPVGLDTLQNPVMKDLLSWMLSHDPKDRPSAEEALKHPYLLTTKQQFEILCKMGNQPEIKKGDSKSEVVRNLNSDPKDWRGLMNPDVLRYFCTDPFTGREFRYSSSWTDCLRLIRNVSAHWEEYPRPRRATFYEVGNPQEYFLDLLPDLPVMVHRIIRSCDWKERPDFKEYFI